MKKTCRFEFHPQITRFYARNKSHLRCKYTQNFNRRSNSSKNFTLCVTFIFDVAASDKFYTAHEVGVNMMKTPTIIGS